MLKFFDGKVIPIGPQDANPDRNELLGLGDVEPNLGTPADDNYMLVSDTDGVRSWVPSSSLPDAYIPKSIINAKGDIVIGISNDNPTILSVGTNGYVLTADSSQPLGIKWAPITSPGVEITIGTGLETDAPGGIITDTGTISLEDTAVVPGSYTSTNLTVDAQGRITFAENGSGGATPTVQYLSYTTPLLSAGSTHQFEINTVQTYQLLSIKTSHPAWVRVYGSDFGRFGDLSRVNPGAPFPRQGFGFFCEVLTSSSTLVCPLSPIPEVQVEASQTLLSLRNEDSVSRQITVVLKVLPLTTAILPSGPPYSCNTNVDPSGQTNLSSAWQGCTLINNFPLVDVSACTNFTSAWQGCSNLRFFPPSLLKNSISTTFNNAFTGCALSQGSVDGILIALDTAGLSGGTLDITGGTNSAPSSAGLLAKTSLESKGWTVNTKIAPTPSSTDIGEIPEVIKTSLDGRVFVGGSGGNVFKSVNNGATFDSGTLAYSGIIRSLAIANGATVLLGGWNETFYRISTDNGVTWSDGTDFEESEIDGILHTGGGNIWVGTSGFVHKSEDNGVTWLPSFEPKPGELGYYQAPCAIGGANDALFGTYYAGFITFTQDNGASWTSTDDEIFVNTPISANVSDGAGTVLGCSKNGEGVFKSTDYGATWDSGTIVSSGSNIYCLAYSSQGYYFAGTDGDGKVYYTSDDGATWQLFFNPDSPGSTVYSLAVTADGYLLAGVDTVVHKIFISPYVDLSIPQKYPTSQMIVSDTTLVPNSLKIANIVTMSQADYDSLTTPDPETLYLIVN